MKVTLFLLEISFLFNMINSIRKRESNNFITKKNDKDNSLNIIITLNDSDSLIDNLIKN